MGATRAFIDRELAFVERRQIARLNATSSDEARRLIIDALGPEPDDRRGRAVPSVSAKRRPHLTTNPLS